MASKAMQQLKRLVLESIDDAILDLIDPSAATSEHTCVLLEYAVIGHMGGVHSDAVCDTASAIVHLYRCWSRAHRSSSGFDDVWLWGFRSSANKARIRIAKLNDFRLAITQGYVSLAPALELAQHDD